MKNPLRSIFDYLSASKAELEKVTWPTQKDVTRYTVMVVTVSVVLALFFAGMDFGFSQGITAILKGRGLTAPTNQTTEIPADNLQPQVNVEGVQVTTSTPSN